MLPPRLRYEGPAVGISIKWCIIKKRKLIKQGLFANALGSSVYGPRWRGLSAWFKSAWFWVTVHTFYVPELGAERLQGEAGLIPRKAGVAEHLQPVRVGFAR